jgi:predicted aldo/keto reductase-like oxidoreductase
MPCPQNLDIAAVLRFHTLFDTYGLINWSKKLYKGLEVGVENCTQCGECEPKCPYKLPIINRLQKAQMNL